MGGAQGGGILSQVPWAIGPRRGWQAPQLGGEQNCLQEQDQSCFLGSRARAVGTEQGLPALKCEGEHHSSAS